MYMDVFITWIELLKTKYNINALILSIEYSKVNNLNVTIFILLTML